MDSHIQRERIDLSHMSGRPVVNQQNPPEEASQIVGLGGSQATAAAKKRKRFKFNSKRLRGPVSMFLDPDYEEEFKNAGGRDDLELDGRIIECPKKKNNNVYKINWFSGQSGVEYSWLRTMFPNTAENKSALQGAIEHYDASIEARDRPPLQLQQNDLIAALPATPPNVAHNSRVEATPTTFMATPRRVDTNSDSRATPPTVIRGARAAAYTTAACRDSNSTRDFSGDRNSTLDFCERANITVTRGHESEVAESESDDGNDLDEDDDAYILSADHKLRSDFQENEYDIPDDTPDEQATEVDLLNQLIFSFNPPSNRNSFQSPPLIDDDISETCLKPDVSKRFNTPLEAMAVLGGFDYAFITRLTKHSNDYAKWYFRMKGDKDRRSIYFNPNPYQDISTKEMYNFLGIMLKISLSPRDSGGYESYFRQENQEILYNNTKPPMEIKNSKGFVSDKLMTLARFKEIRWAFHPEDYNRAGIGGDKCYQVRTALNQVNKAAVESFSVGRNLTFDEGGIPCRSRMCPVRMYNSSKPDKFRVDLFILACSASYVVFNVDVYQGKNSSSTNIADGLDQYPTTMKAPLNAIHQAGLVDDPMGCRHLALDNRYQCPQLAVALSQRGILSSGTVRVNRKGWDKNRMILTKRQAKGTHTILVDHVNHLVAAQWVDSKVVSAITTLDDVSVGQVFRKEGGKMVPVSCPQVMITYQLTMFGVDKGDQIRAHFGGFASKAHFKKWYKKVFLAILDIMLMNSYIGWNMAAKERNPDQEDMARHLFYTMVAEELMEYKDEHPQSRRSTISSDIAPESEKAGGLMEESVEQGATCLQCHQPIQCPKDRNKKRNCWVCKLEMNWGVIPKNAKNGSRANLSICNDCGIVAHTYTPKCDYRKIHGLVSFKNMTCFQIAHSVEGQEIWQNHFGSNNIKSYTIKQRHPVLTRLRELHGLERKEYTQSGKYKRKRSATDTGVQGNDEESSDEGNSEEDEQGSDRE